MVLDVMRMLMDIGWENKRNNPKSWRELRVCVRKLYFKFFLVAAPMNDPKAVVYLAIDNPKNTIQYGGVVAAPMVGEIFEQILPLLNVKKDYKNQIEKELRWYIDTPYHNVPNFINVNKSKIKTSPYYKYLYIGDGNTVIDQEPAYGERIPEGGTIILYLG